MLRLTAVEYSNVDDVYEWDEVEGSDGFERQCLFSGVAIEKESSPSIRTRVRAILEESKPDIVSIPGWIDRPALEALAWCVQNGVPAVVMSETTPWDHPRIWWKEAIKRQIVKCFTSGFAGGTPHAEYLATLGLPKSRIFLGYDAVDNDYFAQAAAKVKARTAEKLETGNLKAETKNEHVPAGAGREWKSWDAPTSPDHQIRPKGPEAGRRTRQHCLEDSPKGATRGSESVNPQPFPVASAPAPQLQLQLPNLNPVASATLFLPGFKQYHELPEYYSRAGAFVHASTSEQWGLVINEAMASGLPVIVSNRCGCAADLVQGGVNGFTFDPVNVNQLAGLMLKISAFNFPLSAFSSASAQIISNWGTDRFASGLQQAAAAALAAGPVKPTLLQKLVLNALLAR